MSLFVQRATGLAMMMLAVLLAVGAAQQVRADNPESATGYWQGCLYDDEGEYFTSGSLYSQARTWGSPSCVDRVAVSHWAWYNGSYHGAGSTGFINHYTVTQYNVSWPTTLLDCYHQVEVDGLQQPNVQYYVS